MQLRIHPAAERELDAALTWCRTQFGKRLAVQLLEKFDRAGEILMAHPDIGTTAPAHARLLPLPRFPYTLVYRVDGKFIHVIALMHQRRRPGYWAGRR
jgi:toxin ParE1/3/4